MYCCKHGISLDLACYKCRAESIEKARKDHRASVELKILGRVLPNKD